MDIIKIFRDPKSKIVISIILGLGLATMFRKSCVGRKCIVIKGPKSKDVQGHVYRIEDSCYKYVPHVVKCGKNTLDD